MKVFLAIFTAIMSIFAPFNSVKAPAEKQTDFTPVIRFTVASDSHVNCVGDDGSQRIQKAISLGYDIARQNEKYKNLDAVLFAGDITDDGTKFEFVSFMSAVNSVIDYDETELLTVAADSHDGYCRENNTFDYYEKLINGEKDFHTVINGFHFIGISASKVKGERYTEGQRTWLKAQLDSAAKDDPAKPIFVMHHEHVFDTVYGSREIDGWGTDFFKDIFEEYPQIVHFSGHSHYPLNDPRSIWQGEFTAVGTGALKYAELTVDGERKIHPDGYNEMAQVWVVEVDAQNTVRLRGYDALSSTLLCEYYIDNPSDANARQYTPEQQKKANANPPTLKEISVKKTSGKCNVTISRADGDVFLYRFYVIGADGNEKSSCYVVDKYWVNDGSVTISKTVEAEKGDTIKVVAENAYGVQSEAIEYTI